MRNRVLRDLTVVLLAKLAFLSLLYFLFFNAAHQPPIDPTRVAARVLGMNASSTER